MFLFNYTESSLLRIHHWLELALQQEFFWKDCVSKLDYSIRNSLLDAFLETSSFYQVSFILPMAKLYKGNHACF